MSRRGRPPTFTRDELIAAAKQLGPDDLGLQAVARALGVARTTLYWHVRDENELGELVLASILNEAGVRDWAPGDVPWDEWLAAYARTLRSTLLQADDWLRYATGRLFYSHESLVNADRLVAALVADGFSVEEASKAFTMVSEIVFANVRTATEADAPKEAGRNEFLASVRALDRDELPNLRAALKARSSISFEMQFEYDLACALSGIRAHAAHLIDRST